MITQVTIKNFRSIAEMQLDLGRITVLTGANNSGKSSVIYALLALKSIMTNPNQTLDGILNLGFINLGGFKETIYKKQEEKKCISLNIATKSEDVLIQYEIRLYKAAAIAELQIPNYSLNHRLAFGYPYLGDQQEELSSDKLPNSNRFLWNGITTTSIKKHALPPEASEAEKSAYNINASKAREVERIANNPFESISNLDAISVRRGFTKPFFSPVPLTQQIVTEDEIATVLYADRELASAVAHHLEKIVDRQFSVNPVANTTNFYLQTRDKTTGFTADLVNEGLGTNQLVTILAKALYKNASFICIDEPEIHLHPTIIDKLVNVLIEIAEERNKQFLISTHSEHFISALLNAVTKKKIAADDIKVYHLTKDKWETKAELQRINNDGQIEGGLSHFYAAELSGFADFFNADKA